VQICVHPWFQLFLFIRVHSCQFVDNPHLDSIEMPHSSQPHPEAASHAFADSPLFNEDLAPTKPAQRTWSFWSIASLWISMIVIMLGIESIRLLLNIKAPCSSSLV
jgi:cytosine/uracil/thiamine/allantoin permease